MTIAPQAHDTPVGERAVAGLPVGGSDGSIGTATGTRRSSENDQHDYLMVRTSRLFGLMRNTRMVPMAWLRRGAPESGRLTLNATRAQVDGCPPLREDADIQADVVDILANTGGYFRVPEIRSSVVRGVVELSGHAPNARIKEAAVSRAMAVSGVLDVRDHSFEDSALILAVAQALTAEDDTRASHLVVTSRLGVIGLNGTVPSEAAGGRATALAMAVPGVAQVVNSAAIRGARASGARASLSAPLEVGGAG